MIRGREEAMQYVSTLQNTKTSCLISVMVTWENPLNQGFPLFTIRVEVVEYPPKIL